ncbi:hypothetical protein HK100_004127 [Physocladia obscura]|uniref:Uncharacterized protein n=1 Tax=Physocladia obscura TaxID=109957 RepID=A0AAD5T787_9FUNG|nr:hypothetical protein HK100_004127 [Physocladia obscura]
MQQIGYFGASSFAVVESGDFKGEVSMASLYRHDGIWVPYQSLVFDRVSSREDFGIKSDLGQ